MRDLIIGARSVWTGFSLLRQPRIRRYALLPFLLSALMFAGIVYFGASQFDRLIDACLANVPGWLSWLGAVLWFVFAALAILVLVFTFALIASLVSSPFNGPLAAAVEQHLAGAGPPTLGWGQTIRRMPVTLVVELAKVLFVLVAAVPFLVLFWIPIINVAAPPLWFLFSAWVIAFGSLDYAMSNHGASFGQIRRAMRERPALCFGFGAMALLFLAVPIVNLVAVPASVCGGAVLWVEEFRRVAPAVGRRDRSRPR